MKKYLVISIIALLFVFITKENKAIDLQSYFYFATFYTPTEGPYVETYLAVIGNSVVYKKNSNNKYQASLEVTMLFKQDGEIKKYNKYNLYSDEIDDTTFKSSFIDQQRILLPNGIYNYEMTIVDKNTTEKKEFKMHDIIAVSYNNLDLDISGIQLVEFYKKSEKESILTKSGLDLSPYVATFYPENVNKITFYTEIYNSNKESGTDSSLLFKYYIENANNLKSTTLIGSKKQKKAEVNVLFAEIPIVDLVSGNYNLVVQVINKENIVLKSKKVFFQRSNKKAQVVELNELYKQSVNNTFVVFYTNEDTLKEYIKSTWPIANSSERQFATDMLKNSSLEAQQKFFYNFWVSRNADYPENAWIQYKEKVAYVQRKYKTLIKKGYESDRGRVYLQYGPPSSIVDVPHEPIAYPYEIWHYYAIKDKTNKKFVFYNPDIAGNDYPLLHSDMTGEIITRNWEDFVYKRIDVNLNNNSNNPRNSWGSHTQDNFK